MLTTSNTSERNICLKFLLGGHILNLNSPLFAMTNKSKQRRYNKSIWEESHEPNFDFKKSKCFVPSPQISPSVYTITNSVWRNNKKSTRNSKLNRRKEWKKKFSCLKSEKWKKFINTAGCFIILSGFLYQSSTFLSIFYNYPTMVEFNVANEVQLDFPAVTVCNSNPVRYKIWCKENPSICIRKPGETLEEIRVRHTEEYDKLSRQKRIELGSQYKDFVLYAEYEDAILTEPFAEYYDYEFTNCFTFNSRWGEQQEVKPAVLFNPVTGKASELLLCLNMDVDNYNNMTDTPSGRVKMVIHANDIVPNPTYDAASLEAGAFYSYGIQKVMTKLLESPYQTKCRNYEEEREIRTGAKMSQKNCLLECYKTQTEKKCGCTYRRLSLMYSATPCQSNYQKKCLKVVEEEVFNTCNPLCPMACKQVEFQYVATDKEPLREKSSFYERMGINQVFNTGEEMNKNMACVRIHYGSTEIRTLTHQPKYESIEVFSLLGGYSGLWLGFSLLSCYNYILKKFVDLVQKKTFSNSSKS